MRNIICSDQRLSRLLGIWKWWENVTYSMHFNQTGSTTGSSKSTLGFPAHQHWHLKPLDTHSLIPLPKSDWVIHSRSCQMLSPRPQPRILSQVLTILLPKYQDGISANFST